MSLVANPVLGVNLRQNKNSKSLAFGKYYAEVDRQKTLNIRGFAEHMISHGCVYDRGDIESILVKVTECLPELVAQGIPIQLGELGIFYPSIQSRGINQVTAGLDPRDVVHAVHLRFLPNASKLGDLSGPAFKDRCTLELRNIIESIEMEGQGDKKFVKLTPIATFLAEQEQPEP